MRFVSRLPFSVFNTFSVYCSPWLINNGKCMVNSEQLVADNYWFAFFPIKRGRHGY